MDMPCALSAIPTPTVLSPLETIYAIITTRVQASDRVRGLSSHRHSVALRAIIANDI
jgi:hypothetical protein